VKYIHYEILELTQLEQNMHNAFATRVHKKLHENKMQKEKQDISFMIYVLLL
jgi:hypothetical protein